MGARRRQRACHGVRWKAGPFCGISVPMADPIIVKLLGETVGLRAGGLDAEQEVLATYRDEAGIDAFALCRDGLLLRSGEGWRFIGHGEIERVAFPIDKVRAAFEMRELCLILKSGEQVEMPVDGRRETFLDLFPLQAFLRRRVHQHHA